MTAREAALRALIKNRQYKSPIEKALNSLITNADIPVLETALATQILNGVVQNRQLCDHYAAYYSSIKLNKLEPQVLDILRLSIYQIVFLTKIPNSAAVNEAVALAKKFSNLRAAGYINAVLRRIVYAAESNALPEITGSITQRLSTGYSHPEWLVKEILSILGEQGTMEFLAANNSADTPVTVQVNTLITSTDEVQTILNAEGVNAVRHDWLDDCLELRSAGNILRLTAYKKGYIYVQDVAARLAVIAANPGKDDHVIDGCAAPGGKSYTAAIMMRGTGRISAWDISEDKIKHVENTARRLNIKSLSTKSKDARIPSERHESLADVVIADVPCSGFGVIRKKPDIRYKTSDEISSLPELQKSILFSLSSYVATGGTLLYSTCTVLRQENEDVIEWFLRSNRDFEMDGFSLPMIGDVKSGMITLWPHVHETDGFFICKLKKHR